MRPKEKQQQNTTNTLAIEISMKTKCQEDEYKYVGKKTAGGQWYAIEKSEICFEDGKGICGKLKSLKSLFVDSFFRFFNALIGLKIEKVRRMAYEFLSQNKVSSE